MNISLTNLLLSSFGLFILFKFVLLPFAAKVAANDSSAFALKKYITRNIVDFGSLFFLLTTISSALVWIIVKIVNIRGDTTYEEVKSSLSFVKSVDSITSSLASDWAIITTILLAAALIILSYKSTNKSFDEKLNIALSKELERLQKEFDDGEWVDLLPTDEMGHVYELMHEYEKNIAELQQSASSEDEITALNSLIENKENLVSYLEQLDIQRRINIEIEEESYPDPKSLKDKILLFFVSKGLMNTFKKGGSIVFIIGVLLLIPSLLSIGSRVVSDNIETKMALLGSTVEKFELEIQAKEVADDFKEITKSKDRATDEPLTDEDEKVLNELSQVFENNVVEARTLGRASINFARASRITSHAVRNAILDQFATSDNRVKVHTSGAITEVVGDAVKLEQRAIISNEPTTNLGKRFKGDLRKVATSNKELWSHYKKLTIDATKSFQVPASARSVKGMMISNVVGHISQGIELPGSAGKIAGNLSKIPSDVAEKFYLNESKRYMVALARAEHLDDAVKTIGEAKYKSLPAQHIEELKAFSKKIPEEGRLSSILRDNPPSLSRKVESHVQLSKAQDTVRNIAKVNNSAGTQRFADALSSFGDYFPGYEGEEKRTAKGKTTASSSSYSSRGYSASKAASVRSRSYGKLRGFSRIGGVLIGRMPTGENSLDVTDLKWKKEGDNYSLTLVSKNDGQVIIGQFNPAIIYLALGYVADGRVTTITMVSSDPLYDLRILLHPVLVDTGLGCRAIKLDQIADETTSENSELKQLRQGENLEIANARILYSFSWASRLKQISNNDQDIAGQITEYLEYANSIIIEYSEEVQSILAEKNYNLDFLSEKIDFYDKDLLKIIKKCRNTNSYKECIEENSPTYVTFNNPTWLYPPAKTTEWSGVRELEYILDNQFNFLKTSNHDELWPFRFMVQTVFTSQPYFADVSENYSDSNPWEFKSVNKLLMKTIIKDLPKKQDMESLIQDMREFAILQRLFRVALNNKLGDNFPLEKLAALAKETKPLLPGYNRTLRWLPKPGAIERVLMLSTMQGGNAEKAEKTAALQQRLRKELGLRKDEEQIIARGDKPCAKP